jgi:hypothetical protein
VQVIDDCVVTGTAPNQARTDDGYLGFNTIATSWQPTISSVPGGDLNAVGGPTGTAVPFGGVILFDATVSLPSRDTACAARSRLHPGCSTTASSACWCCPVPARWT